MHIYVVKHNLSSKLTLSALQPATNTLTNSVDLVETVHTEPSHQILFS